MKKQPNNSKPNTDCHQTNYVVISLDDSGINPLISSKYTRQGQFYEKSPETLTLWPILKNFSTENNTIRNGYVWLDSDHIAVPIIKNGQNFPEYFRKKESYDKGDLVGFYIFGVENFTDGFNIDEIDYESDWIFTLYSNWINNEVFKIDIVSKIVQNGVEKTTHVSNLRRECIGEGDAMGIAEEEAKYYGAEIVWDC